MEGPRVNKSVSAGQHSWLHPNRSVRSMQRFSNMLVIISLCSRTSFSFCSLLFEYMVPLMWLFLPSRCIFLYVPTVKPSENFCFFQKSVFVFLSPFLLLFLLLNIEPSFIGKTCIYLHQKCIYTCNPLQFLAERTTGEMAKKCKFSFTQIMIMHKEETTKHMIGRLIHYDVCITQLHMYVFFDRVNLQILHLWIQSHNQRV